MAQASKRKIEFVVQQNEVAELLKRLGQAMESGTLSVGETSIDLRGLYKLSFSAKSAEEGEGVRVKLKTKYADGEGAGTSLFGLTEYDETEAEEEYREDAELDMAGAKPKYKSLKKQMKSQFKAIREALESGRLPDRPLCHAFVRNSELMVTYPGKGDEYYERYTVAVGRFITAVTENDLTGAAASAEELEVLKKDCHDKYE